MKRINTSRAANAYGGPAGGTGHWQDTDPLGATQFDAMWTEGMQEAVCGVIEGLGGTLAGDETGQLWGLLSPRVDGILSDLADTTATSTTHKRVLLASSTSRASGINSAVVASGGSLASGADAAVIASDSSTASAINSAVMASTTGTASGNGAAVIASDTCIANAANSATLASTSSTSSGSAAVSIAADGATADGDYSAVIASDNGYSAGNLSAVIASENGKTVGDDCSVISSIGCYSGKATTGYRAVVVASEYCENVEPNTLALGYGVPGIVQSGTNQNRTIILRGSAGEGEFTGAVEALDFTLISGKAVSRCVSLAAATALAAGDWTLNGPPVSGQTILHWTPSSAGKYLYVPIQCRVGERLDTVGAYVKCDITAGSTVRGRVIATDSTGLTYVSAEQTWTTASDGSKDMDCSGHFYVADRSYYVAFWVDGGDTAPTNAAEGLISVRLDERVLEI